MSTWNVRRRIVATFAAIIVIMVVLGVVTYLRLGEIESEAIAIQADHLPGVLFSTERQALAREMLPAVLTRASSSDPVARRRASQTLEAALRRSMEIDSQYTLVITSDTEAVPFRAAVAAREKFVEVYRAAAADSTLTEAEVNGQLRPVIEGYVAATDALVDVSRREGQLAAQDILGAVQSSRRTMEIGLVLATVVSLLFAWMLLSMLDGLIGQVQQSGIQVNSSATEIAATSKQQQATATEIAATTSEVGATASRISATSKELVRTMDEVVQVADETATLAEGGQSGLQRMGASMQQIGEASSLINSRLALLSEKAANIGLVVTTINKVADQTNLLSLNAAIEAEKAGEHGRGFTVVAREIRRLADQTAGATFDIEQLVKEMQSAVSAGVMGMDKFSDEVRRGGEVITQVTTQLSAIIEQVQMLTPSFDAVNEGVKSQSISAGQISDALSQLSVAAQQTADSLRQSNMAIEQLNEAARGLQSGVSKFTQDG
jgi:methyl-accepting chemotaxis protein WspA